jgi:hypothetical protein
MTADDFSKLRPGQRLLLLGKFFDVLASKDAGLLTARREFLRVLPKITIHLPKEDFQKIVGPSLDHGFEVEYEFNRAGDERIREALNAASMAVAQPNHAAMCDELIAWVNARNLDSRPGWFYHELRELVEHLMANPVCEDSHASQLAVLRQKIGALQKARAAAPSDTRRVRVDTPH